MRILVDMDGVLCDFAGRILEWYNHDNGTHLTKEQNLDWEMEHMLGPGGKDFIRSCMRWPEFFTRLDPIPGAVEGMHDLLRTGHDVVIVTSIPSSAGIAFAGKQQWIRDHIPDFKLKNFVGATRKELVRGNVLLDDAPHNIEAFMAENRENMGVVFDAPYNWKMAVEPTRRVRDWNEFLAYVHSFDVPFG